MDELKTNRSVRPSLLPLFNINSAYIIIVILTLSMSEKESCKCNCNWIPIYVPVIAGCFLILNEALKIFLWPKVAEKYGARKKAKDLENQTPNSPTNSPPPTDDSQAPADQSSASGREAPAGAYLRLN